MNFIESLDFFGIKAKEIPCIPHEGAPTTATEGAVGSLCMDTTTGAIYKCIAAESGVYTWEVINSSTPTDEQIAEAVEDYIAENPIAVTSSVEPAEDDIPKVFIDGVKPTTKDDVLAEMRYVSKTDTFHAYLEIKCQGSSSMQYSKKNYTIKMYSDEARATKLKRDFKDWGHPGNKFVLKANYIDASHARNIVSARIWDEVVSSRDDYATLPELMRTSPRNGAVDGFPVKVYYNGTYDGLYTWNIGKDDWMWNMDEDNPNHLLLCAEVNTTAAAACNFNSLCGSSLTASGWSVEVGTETAAHLTSFNNLISCVMNTDDATFKATIGNHMDVQSAIDYYLHHYVICGLDGLAKNMLMATYDGVIWICGSYDMDGTFGLMWNGASFVSATYACPEQYQAPNSLLWQRMEKCFKTELQERYTELRRTVYSYANMVTHFERFMDVIGLDLYAEDLKVSKGQNSTNNNITQIRDFIRDRLAYVDTEIATLGETVYTVTNTLTNAETDNTAVIATEGSSYTANITPAAGTSIESISVTMGGIDVTETVYADGVINIESVTGNIVITVVAVHEISEEGLLYSLSEATTFDGSNVVDTGINIANEAMDWSIVITLRSGTQTAYPAVLFSNEPEANKTQGLLTCSYTSAAERIILKNYSTIANCYAQGTNGSATNGKEVKIVFTRDMTTPKTTSYVSVDGTVQETYSNGQAFRQLSGNMTVGGCKAADGTINGGFVGTIYDFRIYNRVLTTDEVNAYIS